MRELSLFSGAGGGLLGTKWLLGWRTIGYVEIEPYCQEILKARIADGYLDAAPIFGDIRAFIADGYADAYRGMVDVITGGFPCQDISCAGNRAGIGGERSGLWKEMAEAIRIIGPKFILLENSPILTVRGLGTILCDVAEMGFNARWGVFSYAEIGGGSQERECLLPAPIRSLGVSFLGGPLRTDETWSDTGRLDHRLIGLWKGWSQRENGARLGEKIVCHPSFAEYLMGWCMNWTALKPLETDRFHEWLNEHGRF